MGQPEDQWDEFDPKAAREKWAADRNLKPMKWGDRNIARVFRSGGSYREHCLPLARWVALGGGWGSSPPFDHGEIWGRDGCPLMIVGHPYELTEDGRTMVRTIAAFGLDVRTDGESYYGFGTVQIMVLARSATDDLRRHSLMPKMRSMLQTIEHVLT